MRFTLCFVFCLLSAFLLAQEVEKHWLDYPDSLNKKRVVGVAASASAITIGTLIGLNELWYSEYPRSSFQTFDDSDEWLGIDKVGHGLTSYYIGTIGYQSLRWSGVKENKAIWYGGTWGFAYLTAVEILDGHSAQWGFSWADMAANTIGTGLFIGQQLAWGEQRILPKFSFHSTQFAQYRPNLLGKEWYEQILKDYNGQTYWLSINIHSFLSEESRFPKWLSVSGGYGATGMIGGSSNPSFDDSGNPYPPFDRYSQYYFSLDVDLHRIKTKSRFANSVLTALGWLKFPLPAIEFNKNGAVFHPIYF